MTNKGKFILAACIGCIALFGLVYLGLTLTSGNDVVITDKNKAEYLTKYYGDIDVTTAKEIKGQINLDPADVAEELPAIEKYAVTVQNETESYVEIFSSPEKAGDGNDSWLNDVAKEFNAEKMTVNGKKVSVKIRNIASGTATEYITSGKYVPDAFSPSNELWGEIVKSKGIQTQLISKRLIGNVAGIVLAKSTHEKLTKTYGSVNTEAVTEAMIKNELAMGYTDPFQSSTGLNFLVTALNTFDKENLLSEKAISGFEQFQNNVPFIASTTLQMRVAAQSGTLSGFVLESQIFENEAELQANYIFTPFGVRHDSPLYALGNISEEKKMILEKFAAFSAQDKYQKLGEKKGFNELDKYENETKVPTGSTLAAAQKIWKEKKNGDKPIVAVFVADVSGSMSGEPINQLKESLIKGQKYLGRENSIGLVSYSNDVTINLPIATYDANQQSKFVGAIENLRANGGTATNDGVIVALKLLQDEMEKNPNSTPIIFVLSDGESNQGISFKKLEGLVKAYEVPIYTIGYNANIEALETLSKINEAASINASTDDVVYKIRNLFNVQM